MRFRDLCITLLPVTLSLLACACGGRPSANSRFDFSSFDVFLNVPFHEQAASSLCGLAAMEMTADHYGRTLNAAFVKKLKKEASLTGALQAASMKACFEASGFDAAVFPGLFNREINGIYRHLDLKRPLIVLIAERPGVTGHFLVLEGYKRDAFLAVADPAGGVSAAAVPNFSPLWKNGGYLTLLVLPKK